MEVGALCQRETGRLVVIDIQARLAGAMPSPERERVVRNSGILLQAADLLGVPSIATEQYPQGLGPTELEVTAHFPDNMPIIDKTCFSCCSAPAFKESFSDDRRQIVLAGMETHVCVLQTALELAAEDYTVFVVEDAVCSRDPANHRNALARLRRAGVIITNTESVLFEWLRDARDEHFKAVSRLVK